MRHISFGKALWSLALFAFCLSLPLSGVFAQAHHEYAQPNPQHYQHAPTPTRLPSFAPAPSAPQQQETSPSQPAPQAVHGSMAGSDDIMGFVQEHMAAIFLGMLLLAPLGAMLAMRKTSHPYDH